MKADTSLTSLLENTQRTVFFKCVIKPNPEIVYVSPAVETLLGYGPDALYGDPTAIVDLAEPTDKTLLHRFFQDPESCPSPMIVNYRHRDGSQVTLEYDYHVIRDGDVVEVEGLAQDVTAKRAKEMELEMLSHELERARFETLRRLALAAEYRDDQTHEHTQRVAETCGLICRSLGLSEDQTNVIKLAAPLHDVGKIGIPDRILLKPGRLTRSEFEEMKTHTTIGGAILSGSHSPILDVGADIALGHHERWDGTGYPAGVAREAIPLPARILAVADVLDALMHDRPYKPAWPLERALQEILDGRGSQFAPDVVDALFRVIATPEEAALASVIDLR
ncbi:MAG: HD domain-containing phosphohydrolase [Actinomycetota bacterium]